MRARIVQARSLAGPAPSLSYPSEPPKNSYPWILKIPRKDKCFSNATRTGFCTPIRNSPKRSSIKQGKDHRPVGVVTFGRVNQLSRPQRPASAVVVFVAGFQTFRRFCIILFISYCGLASGILVPGILVLCGTTRSHGSKRVPQRLSRRFTALLTPFPTPGASCFSRQTSCLPRLLGIVTSVY